MAQDKSLILAIDQGTTGSTALLISVDPRGATVLNSASQEFPQHFPQDSWVEHDLDELWSSCREAIKKALETPEFRENPRSLAAIGITNQRETLTVYDHKTLRPVRRAIVWQCRRSTDICNRIKNDGLENQIRKDTGLVCDPYFTGTKLKWIIDNEPSTSRAILSGKAAIGTIDTFLVSKLTGGKSYVTEPSNASRTMLYNIRSGQWDSDLCRIFGLPNTNLLPTIQDSAGKFGETSGLDFLPDGIPITGILGDQQAALAGQGCFGLAETKCTYGTGAFILTNVGGETPTPPDGLLGTVAWSQKGKLTYAVEGSSFIAGAAVQFLRDNLQLIESAPQTSTMASNVVAGPELLFVPALTGLGAPWWQPKVRGAILGLTRATSKEQIARACLEGIALQVMDLSSALGETPHSPPFRVDGGASANDVLMQIQADLLERPIQRPRYLETTALGAAYFAGIGGGIFKSVADLEDGFNPIEKTFTPTCDPVDQKRSSAVKNSWKIALEMLTQFHAGN